MDITQAVLRNTPTTLNDGDTVDAATLFTDNHVILASGGVEVRARYYVRDNKPYVVLEGPVTTALGVSYTSDEEAWIPIPDGTLSNTFVLFEGENGGKSYLTMIFVENRDDSELD